MNDDDFDNERDGIYDSLSRELSKLGITFIREIEVDINEVDYK